jgi:cytochrome c oxidase subunit 2
MAALYLGFMAATVGSFWIIKWQLQVASEHGKGVDAMILFLLVATGAMFVAGHAIVAWFLLASRRGENEPFTAPGPKREWTATLLPIVIVAIVAEGGVLVIGMPVWAQISGRDPDALQVEVVAKQFEWVARYPGKDGVFGKLDAKQADEQLNVIGLDERDPAAADDVVLRGTLVLPAGRMASIRIRSMDVLHSFTVPLFRTKQDAVPGLVTRTQVRPTVPGVYEITCAELCGMGHYKMQANALVVTPEEFAEAMKLEPEKFASWAGARVKAPAK